MKSGHENSTACHILLPLSHQELLEVEIEFTNAAGDPRRLIINGFDLEEIPHLESSQYVKGVYASLGFGAPFVQAYRGLEKSPPDESPFFSVWLDGETRVINYRQDIGLNGLALDRDIQDETRLHIYLLSYERITLVGHYVVDLKDF